MAPNQIVVVGGGLAGLAASISLARAGKRVTLFERSQQLGGRATTQLYDGFRFNLGPHAVYSGGAGREVLRELAIHIFGRRPPNAGVALRDGKTHRLPGNLASLLVTSLLTPAAKLEAAKFMLLLTKEKTEHLHETPLSGWLSNRIQDAELRQFFEALFRLATYCDDPTRQSAAAAVQQLQTVFRDGVLYVDEGWQTIVDALRGAAVSSGVNFVTSSRVVAVVHDQAVRGIALGELESDVQDVDSYEDESGQQLRQTGTMIPADAVILAIGPKSAAKLIHPGSSPTLDTAAREAEPVRVASLDLALRALPNPRATFVLGIDAPLYFSAHSAYARLAPAGGATLQAMKYLRGGTGDAEAELESLLDNVQPGWRAQVVHRRFLPRLPVSNSLIAARRGGLRGRPTPRVPEIDGLYVAGDWVGSEGMLSDASLASAREAARSIVSGTSPS